MIRICVDVMGGDYAPKAIMDGVNETLNMYGDTYQLLLVGPEEIVTQELKRIGKEGDPRIKVVPATQIIEMGEHPAKAVRSKPDSSICVCMKLVKDGEADAVFSAGNTGACVTAALLRWGRIRGIDRPALGTLFPSEGKPFLLVDAGATVDCRPEWLLQFAMMGSIFMEKVFKRPKPVVGLLSNGTEPDKGCKVVQDAHKLFQSAKDASILNFTGNVEGHGIFRGDIDVVACDGFVGNVFLKTGEQLALAIGHIIKRGIKQSPWRMAGALMMKGAFMDLKKQTDYSEYGGAPLLGVNGVCIIGHGISDAKAVRNGIRIAGEAVTKQLPKLIGENVEALTPLLILPSENQ